MPITTYTVRIIVDGNEYYKAEVVGGERVGRPADPSKVGYIFLGWFDGETGFNFATPITGNLTLTARWEEYTGQAPITSLRINASAIVVVARGGQYSFGLNLNPGASGANVVWIIADQSFGSVDNNGNVTIFNRTGNVRLTATDPVSGLRHSIILMISS